MNIDENRYWPFEVLPSQKQTDQHRGQIVFLEEAYRAGYKPCTFGAGNFGATAGDRAGVVLFRRQNHWEVRLGTNADTSVSAHLDDFDCAAQAILQWLGGEHETKIIEHVRQNLVITRSTTPGFVLHSQDTQGGR